MIRTLLTRPIALASALLLVLAGCGAPPRQESDGGAALEAPRRSLLVAIDQADAAALRAWKARGFSRLAVALGDGGAGLSAASLELARAAAEEAGMELDLWLEVGRSPALAAERPEWLAGIGLHDDWRRRFPAAPPAEAGRRVVVWPWAPITYRAVLEHHAAAIPALLRGKLRGGERLFLSGVQGAPSACGCGNDQCRWTADYGRNDGPERAGGVPARELIQRLEAALPALEIVPVLASECEEADQAPGGSGYCGAVPCFRGRCWKESSRELEALAEGGAPIGLLALVRLFGREAAAGEPRARWIAAAIAGLEEIPRAHGRKGVPAAQVIAVLQGWDASPAELEEEIAQAAAAGARETLVALAEIEQSWEPRAAPDGR
jgi:hypothetical protein